MNVTQSDHYISLTDSLKDELKTPVLLQRRIIASLPFIEEDDFENSNQQASPLLARMNLAYDAEEQKSSRKRGISSAQASYEDPNKQLKEDFIS